MFIQREKAPPYGMLYIHIALVQTDKLAKCMHKAHIERKRNALDMSGAEHLVSIVSIVLCMHCLEYENLTFHNWKRHCRLNKC